MSDFCWLWEPSCRFVLDAGWVQAVASVAAILFASKIAIDQVDRQHQNDLSLQDLEQKRRKKSIIDAICKVVRGAQSVMGMILKSVQTESNTSCRIEGHKVNLFRDSLRDLEHDLSSISIFDLPDPELVTDYFMLRTTIKQTIYNFEGLVASQPFDKVTLNAFTPAMENARSFLDAFYEKLGKYE